MAVVRDILEAIHQRRGGANSGSDFFSAINAYARTPQEITPISPGVAPIFPVDYSYLPGNVKRYGATGNGVTDDWAAIQQAIDGCSTGIIFLPSGIYKISQPLLIRLISFTNIILWGESRTSTYIMPLTVDISHSPQNINTMVFNQADNGKLSFFNLRFSTDVAYTGIAIYCKEGGGADGSGNAIFSGSIDNCWFDHNSTSTGVLRGGLNNYRVSNNTFEFMKGCFYRDGGGMGDVLFTNNAINNAYDAFYDGMTDTVGDNFVTIDGLHLVGHNRGQAIQTQNSNSMVISNVTVQANSPNLGTVGLFSFKNCTNILASNFICDQVSIFGGSGLLGEVITIEGSEVKLAIGTINIPDVGLRVTGTSASILDINGVDIFNAITCSFRVLTGTPTGRVTVRNSNWSDSQSNIILFSNAAGIDFFMSDCRVMNAGLGAIAGARNFNLNTSGTVVITNCRIGHDNVAAIGAFYFDVSGAGTYTVIDPTIVGTPPSGLATGAAVVNFDGVTGTWTPSLGGTATYTVQQGTYTVKSKCVNFWGRLTVNAIGTGSSTTINGLPLTNNATYYGGGQAHFFGASVTAVTWLGLTVAPGTTQCVMRSLAAAAVATANNNIFGAGTDLIFSGSYQLT